MKTYKENPKKLVKSSRQAQNFYAALDRLHLLANSKKYCLTISDQHKFVWYRVAKVGTRTIFHTLNELGVNLSVGHAYDVYLPPRCFDEYFKFAFVRNPFDRLVSCWLSKVVKKNKKIRFGADEDTWKSMQEFSGFIGFIETLDLQSCDEHLRSQSSLIDLSMIDFLGRMETFTADFTEVLNIIGVPINELKSRNVSESRADDVERVYRLYQKDCQIFGYSF